MVNKFVRQLLATPDWRNFASGRPPGGEGAFNNNGVESMTAPRPYGDVDNALAQASGLHSADAMRFGRDLLNQDLPLGSPDPEAPWAQAIPIQGEKGLMVPRTDAPLLRPDVDFTIENPNPKVNIPDAKTDDGVIDGEIIPDAAQGKTPEIAQQQVNNPAIMQYEQWYLQKYGRVLPAEQRVVMAEFLQTYPGININLGLDRGAYGVAGERFDPRQEYADQQLEGAMRRLKDAKTDEERRRIYGEMYGALGMTDEEFILADRAQEIEDLENMKSTWQKFREKWGINAELGKANVLKFIQMMKVWTLRAGMGGVAVAGLLGLGPVAIPIIMGMGVMERGQSFKLKKDAELRVLKARQAKDQYEYNENKMAAGNLDKVLDILNGINPRLGKNLELAARDYKFREGVKGKLTTTAAAAYSRTARI